MNCLWYRKQSTIYMAYGREIMLLFRQHKVFNNGNKIRFNTQIENSRRRRRRKREKRCTWMAHILHKGSVSRKNRKKQKKIVQIIYKKSEILWIFSFCQWKFYSFFAWFWRRRKKNRNDWMGESTCWRFHAKYQRKVSIVQKWKQPLIR